MKCEVCERCKPHPQIPGKCLYGGPFAGLVKADGRALNEAAYIGEAYGLAAPPERVNGRWEPRYLPFGPQRFASFDDYLTWLKENRDGLHDRA